MTPRYRVQVEVTRLISLTVQARSAEEARARATLLARAQANVSDVVALVAERLEP